MSRYYPLPKKRGPLSPRPTLHLGLQVEKMRAQGIDISLDEIIAAVRSIGHFQPRVQTRVLVKQFPKVVKWKDTDGTVKRGNLLLAVVDVRYPGDRGRIATAMVRKSQQDNSARKLPGATDIVHSY